MECEAPLSGHSLEPHDQHHFQHLRASTANPPSTCTPICVMKCRGWEQPIYGDLPLTIYRAGVSVAQNVESLTSSHGILQSLYFLDIGLQPLIQIHCHSFNSYLLDALDRPGIKPGTEGSVVIKARGSADSSSTGTACSWNPAQGNTSR